MSPLGDPLLAVPSNMLLCAVALSKQQPGNFVLVIKRQDLAWTLEMHPGEIENPGNPIEVRETGYF